MFFIVRIVHTTLVFLVNIYFLVSGYTQIC